MAIYNVGSINADFFYYMDHLPAPGETLKADSFAPGLGGKGANQSVAAAQAGAQVIHVGAIGSDGQWAKDRLGDYEIDVSHILTVSDATGHAIINVDTTGENSIIIYAGANGHLTQKQVERALSEASPRDILLLQNEVNISTMAARIASAQGLRVFYSAAPFDVTAVKEILPYIDTLLLNEVEAEQLSTALAQDIAQLDVPHVLITRGAAGVSYLSGPTSLQQASFKVDAIDTTGAGDCFAGFFTAAMQGRISPQEALRFASAASALKVQKRGTSDAFPSREEVEAFLSQLD